MTTSPTVRTRAGEQSLIFTREFDAPASRVFQAHVDPNMFGRWTGPRGTICDLEHFDPTTGGSFRYSVIGDKAYTFHGCYHEVTAPSRIVHTWEFVGDPGRPTLETLTFIELELGRCRIEGLSLYISAEQCAEMLEFDQSGDGMDENFERLDEMLANELG